MDINEIAALFHIHETAMKHGEAFKNIRDHAWAQLKEIDQMHAPKEPEAEPELKPEPELVYNHDDLDDADHGTGESQSQRRV